MSNFDYDFTITDFSNPNRILYCKDTKKYITTYFITGYIVENNKKTEINTALCKYDSRDLYYSSDNIEDMGFFNGNRIFFYEIFRDFPYISIWITNIENNSVKHILSMTPIKKAWYDGTLYFIDREDVKYMINNDNKIEKIEI